MVFEITCSGDTSLCLQLVHRTHHLSVDFNRHKFDFLLHKITCKVIKISQTIGVVSFQ